MKLLVPRLLPPALPAMTTRVKRNLGFVFWSSANGEFEHLLKTDNKLVSLVVRASVALHSVQRRPGQEKPGKKVLEISSNCETTKSKTLKICTVAFLRVIQNLDTWGPYHPASYEVGQGRPWPGRLFLSGFWKQFLHDLRYFIFPCFRRLSSSFS